MDAVWISLAAGGGALVAVAVGRFLWNMRPQPEMSGLPTTPLERLGWIGLAITGLVGLGLAALVVFVGVTDLQENTISRGISILMLGGLTAWLLAWSAVKRRSGGAVVDERDRAILARSLSVESMVVLLSLVAWTVVLTEVYWDEGVAPVGYFQLLFWSTFVGGAFGRSLGIVMGYRREISVDA